MAALVCSLVWIPYVEQDVAIHPDIAVLPFLRWGLTVVAIAVLGLQFTPYFEHKGMTLLFTLAFYFEIVTGFQVGLTRVDAAYLSGYAQVMMALIITPFTRLQSFFILGLSLLVFTITCIPLKVGFSSPHEKYLLNNIIGAAATSGIFIFFLDRIRHRSYEKSLQLEQQKSQLEKERQESEKLLLNILPPAVASALKHKGEVTPHFFDSVSILFTDFAGFTNTASHMLPDELFDEINQMFHQFDSISRKYNIEKIKTIGDAYMAAGGIPEVNFTHALDVCFAAMEMRDFVNRIDQIREQVSAASPWRIRIGIHTGCVMAGVIGQTKFAYDILGDAVNIASRMESTGVAGEINISKDTQELVKYFFDCQYRGKIAIKNHGEVDMYFLFGLKKEYLDSSGAPNDRFRKIYASLASGARVVSKGELEIG